MFVYKCMCVCMCINTQIKTQIQSFRFTNPYYKTTCQSKELHGPIKKNLDYGCHTSLGKCNSKKNEHMLFAQKYQIWSYKKK